MRLVTDIHGVDKPLLRGRIHLAAFVAAIPAGAVLVLKAGSASARIAALVYALSLVGLYGVSAAYHRLGRSVRSQTWLRRVDHATIYVLIAGTYTPICLLVLTGPMRWTLLAGVWLAAAVGVVLKLASFDPVKTFGSALYIIMGWLALVAFPELASRMPVPVLVLLAVGGVLYTVGAVFLLRRWPDPLPRVFGYHEVWHTMVVVAGICHYAAILHVVSRAA